jgi:HEAT repeat protein
MAVVDRESLDALLARLGGPGFIDFDDRDTAVSILQATGYDVLLPLLAQMLSEDAETRCKASEALLRLDADRGRELVLPLLNDLADGVRYYACECLAKYGGRGAVPALLSVLKSHPDASLRCSAAMGLGQNGGPGVIPDLLAAMASDHEVDEQGYTPSHCAKVALDEMLGTEEMALRFGSYRRIPDRKPDLDRLRRMAEERYRQWRANAEPLDSP